MRTKKGRFMGYDTLQRPTAAVHAYIVLPSFMPPSANTVGVKYTTPCTYTPVPFTQNCLSIMCFFIPWPQETGFPRTLTIICTSGIFLLLLLPRY